MAPKRVAGYVRLSKKTDTTTSPERQRRAIRRLCKDRGWKLVELFEDIDVSAFNGNHRPGWSRLTDRLREFDAIVFWKLDRLSRSTVEAGQIAQACKDADVDLVATDMDIDTTSAGGRFIYTVLAAAGQMESDRLSERAKDMASHKHAEGEWIGRVPTGFMLEGKKLVPDPKQSSRLRTAAERYVAGESFNAIAKDLNMKTTPLRRMLYSERVQDQLPVELKEQLRRALALRRTQRVPTNRQSLLAQIARCDVCGGGMITTGARVGDKYASYACRDSHVGISARFLDELVTTNVLAAVDSTKLVSEIRSRRKAGNANTRKVSEVQARIDLLDEMLTSGNITAERYQRMNANLTTQLEDARRSERDADVYLPEEVARNLTKRWDDLDTATRRNVVRTVLDRVVVEKAAGHGPIDPSRVQLKWRLASQ
jgi:DNA invertase Pin-like site-specific DNA recombinase/polyhydroxyalkanoate synthesis regulator phasin